MPSALSNLYTFNDLINMVIVETARPDMGLLTAGGSGEIPQQVAASVLKMHGLDFFFKDILTAQLKFDNTNGYIQTIDTAQLPRFKAFDYVRKNDPSLAASQLDPTVLPPLFDTLNGQPFPTMLVTKPITILDTDDLFDDYEVEKQDVAYLVGTTFFIKSSTPLNYVLLGWYGWPVLDYGNVGNLAADGVTPNPCPKFSSWIANEYPFAIIYDAASAILQKVGMTDASRKYDAGNLLEPQGLVWSHVSSLIKNNVSARGR